jgi:hypothetical protein
VIAFDRGSAASVGSLPTHNLLARLFVSAAP